MVLFPRFELCFQMQLIGIAMSWGKPWLRWCLSWHLSHLFQMMRWVSLSRYVLYMNQNCCFVGHGYFQYIIWICFQCLVMCGCSGVTSLITILSRLVPQLSPERESCVLDSLAQIEQLQRRTLVPLLIRGCIRLSIVAEWVQLRKQDYIHYLFLSECLLGVDLIDSSRPYHALHCLGRLYSRSALAVK